MIWFLVCDWAKRDCFCHYRSTVLKFSFGGKNCQELDCSSLWKKKNERLQKCSNECRIKPLIKFLLLKTSETSRASKQSLRQGKNSFSTGKKHNKIKSIKITVIVSKNPIQFQIKSMSKVKVMYFYGKCTFELCENP